MIRYLALATVLVVGAIVVATFVPHRAPPHPARDRYVTARGTPGPYQRQPGADFSPQPMHGLATWALSALPECFRQTAIVRGTAAYVEAHAGRGLEAVPAGAVLATADCRLVASPGRIAALRADDVRLDVPHVVRFAVARHGGTVDTVVVETADGPRRTLRRYRVPHGARLHAAPEPPRAGPNVRLR